MKRGFFFVNQGRTNFPKIWESSQNSRPQKGVMKEVLYRGLTNIRRRRDLAPGFVRTDLKNIVCKNADRTAQ